MVIFRQSAGYVFNCPSKETIFNLFIQKNVGHNLFFKDISAICAQSALYSAVKAGHYC